MRSWRIDLAGGLRRLRDAVYPGVCSLCGEGAGGGACLCRGCADSLPGLGEHHCATCGEVFDGEPAPGFSCPNCRDQDFAFDFARPALRRSDGALELVHALKYGRRLELGRELAALALRAFDDPRLDAARDGCWPLVPVPLHRSRRRWRHFNQAEEIARPLARLTGLPVSLALRRVRRTTAQTRLTRHERQRNLRGAFRVVPGREPAAGAVLVDDVFTTGSTAHECARVLRRAGAQNVVVVTVMRG